MSWMMIICALFVSGGILNAWIFRSRVATAYRGGDARTIKEEFSVYGLPNWSFYLIGTLKVLFAISLLMGIFLAYPMLMMVAAIGLGILMLGAVVMHFKVNDPIKKAMPAGTLLSLCLAIIALSVI